MLVRYVFFSLIAAIFLSGCNSSKTSSGSSGPSVTAPGPAIAAYCSTVQSHSSPVTVTGTAQYKRREIFGTRLTGTGGLGSAGAGRPIRYAEIVVTNSSGSIVQCGETAADGSFSLQLPSTQGVYTIAVRSRSENTNLNARVLNTVDSGTLYSLTTTVTVNGAGPFSVGTFTAEATGDVLGGAFNILDNFLEANIFLRARAGNCNGTHGCVNFTVASQVTAYWEKGVNPNTYYFGRTKALSFYLPSYSRLFILGGMNGNTDNSDTDHFDNSVILHEYGHFLEDTAFISDSPGGTHTGTSMIDPRLAWSEGWGNFFQAAVLNSPYYVDTIGNSSGTTSFAFYVDLENQTGSSAYDHIDAPTEASEGLFREFSITRFLWDVLDNTTSETQNTGTDDVTDDGSGSTFGEVWATLTKTTQGFRNPNAAFRNAGFVQLFHNSLTSPTDWTNIRKIEYQPSSSTEYAQYVSTGSSCTYTMNPVSTTGTSLSSSNYLRNNDFYHLKVTSAGSKTITLTYQDANGSGNADDLDLYIYDEDARIGNSADIVGYSWSDPVDSNSNGSTADDEQTETVTVTLSAGDYLINVNAFSSNASAVTYKLKLNGSELCSATLPNP